MSVVSGLVAPAAAYMERAGYSPSSRAGYQRVWDQFGQYCVKNKVLAPDRQSAARFCAAAGADGSAQWQVFYRRAVGCLFDVAETGRFALRAGRGKTPVPEVFAGEFQAYCSWVDARTLAAGTVRAKTGFLRRFMAFAADLGCRIWRH
jgi:hypothetical protein